MRRHRGSNQRQGRTPRGSTPADPMDRLLAGALAPVELTQLFGTAFRLLTENARDVISRYRVASGEFEYVSPSITTMLGYTPEEMRARPQIWNEILHPDDRSLLVQSSVQGFEGTLLIRARHKDGNYVWVELRNVPIYDAAGELVAVEGIARDISERKAFESELARRALHDSLTGRPNKALVV